MAAIPNKKIDRKSKLRLQEFFRRVKVGRKLIWFLVLVATVGLIVIGLLLWKIDSVEFDYGGKNGFGCLPESDIVDSLRHQQVLRMLLGAQEYLIDKYDCIDQVQLRLTGVHDVAIAVKVKQPVLGVIKHKVEVSDSTTWREVFSVNRGASELYFVSADGTVITFAEGAAVPRIDFVEVYEGDQIGADQIAELLWLHDALLEREKTAPRIEFTGLGVVKVRSVALQELYLVVDARMRYQYQKALRVYDYLRLRGEAPKIIDVRLRDPIARKR